MQLAAFTFVETMRDMQKAAQAKAEKTVATPSKKLLLPGGRR
jgi:hypothetical protein